jgi:membrane protease YdiL (CAAX protease family)
VYFVIAAGHWSAAWIYTGTKVAMVAWPLVVGSCWGWPIRLPRIHGWGRIAGEGLALGLVMAGAILAAGFGPLAWLLAEAAPTIAAKTAEFGLTTLAAYVSAALVLTLVHSAFEEWYWRWFAVGQVRRRLRPAGANLLVGLAFSGHHVVVLWVYAGPWAGVLLGATVGGAGVAWSLLYQRHGSLLGAWLAHACCDAAIMCLGWYALHPAVA